MDCTSRNIKIPLFIVYIKISFVAIFGNIKRLHSNINNVNVVGEINKYRLNVNMEQGDNMSLKPTKKYARIMDKEY